ATVATGTLPLDVAVSPDGGSVYVTNAGDNSISQYDVGAGGALTPKSPATVATATGPRLIALSPAPPVYPHPARATQIKVSLVQVFKQCGTGGNPSNAQHSPPLGVSSCNPPQPSSSARTGPSGSGTVTLTVVPGDIQIDLAD